MARPIAGKLPGKASPKAVAATSKMHVRNPNAATPAVRGSAAGRATPAIPSKKR